jgi:sigma-B regulation protein RsbU (phosphoserine phosphatase)
MSQGRAAGSTLPESARQTLQDFQSGLGVRLQLWATAPDGVRRCVFPDGPGEPLSEPTATAELNPRDGFNYELVLSGAPPERLQEVTGMVGGIAERVLDFAKEVRFFTLELSERFEEINLLYSISETLGSILHLEDAGNMILQELCDVLGARKGSLWVLRAESGDRLDLIASVGPDSSRTSLQVSDDASLTAQVFREGRSLIGSGESLDPESLLGVVMEPEDSLLSVPIRYTPPSGTPRTVGVINLMGRRHGGRFTAADQKLLSAIASQVGSALENNRLVRQSVARERMAREMELAHNLQQKLLPSVERVPGARVGARVEPAELVGGDFYQVFRLAGGKVGVMVGDVSSHGFPAALIMALSMSAASIYASETSSPADVLRRLDSGLQDELETTEMYLSLFYGVLDPVNGTLVYSNAGHPHAFILPGDCEPQRLLATDPPVGFAGPDAYGERSVAWDPEHDRLLVFTDGLSDSLTTAEGPSGEERILAVACENRGELPGRVIEMLFDLSRDTEASVPSDDRTAVLVAGA